MSPPLTLIIPLRNQSIVTQNAIGRNIILSIMKSELYLMFEEEAFVLPDSFEEDEIDIFAELGVVNLSLIHI